MIASTVGRVAFLLVLGPTSCLAQGLYLTRTDALADNDVLDAFSIGDAVFVYRQAGLPSPEKAVLDLSKVVPVSRAEIHGRPAADVHSLIEKMAGHRTQLEVSDLSAVNHGAAGFVWKVTYDVLPTHGGFTGVPYQFRSHVRADGSLIVPEKSLCDQFEDGEKEQSLFSVLSLADVEVAVKDEDVIHGDRAQRLATDALEAFAAQKPYAGMPAFRFRSQSIAEMPVAVKPEGQVRYRSVWAVHFVRADAKGPAIMNGDPWTIWVTMDGVTSRLSVGKWRGEPCRPKK